jgi:hypothetical protein
MLHNRSGWKSVYVYRIEMFDVDSIAYAYLFRYTFRLHPAQVVLTGTPNVISVIIVAQSSCTKNKKEQVMTY